MNTIDAGTARAGSRIFPAPFSVVAYRGGADERPENTLMALSYCRSLGVVPEIDLALTSDRRIVALHDETLDRTTDGSGRVDRTPYAVIGQLDAAYRFLDRGGSPRFRDAGVRVPLLEELLAYDDGPLILDLHLRDLAAARTVAKLIEAHDAIDRVCIACLHQEVCDHLCRLPVRPLVAASPRSIRMRVYAERVRLDGCTPAEPAFFVPETYAGTQILTPRFVQMCRRRGERVLVLNADAPDAIQRVRTLGAHGVFTSRPATTLDRLGSAPNDNERREKAESGGA